MDGRLRKVQLPSYFFAASFALSAASFAAAAALSAASFVASAAVAAPSFVASVAFAAASFAAAVGPSPLVERERESRQRNDRHADCRPSVRVLAEHDQTESRRPNNLQIGEGRQNRRGCSQISMRQAPMPDAGQCAEEQKQKHVARGK